ncbi:MAG: response regulator [Candidatus Wallbacteria bacterium]|nr:response regulator [Candidatus Wallbacteria bacterium]
MLKKRILVIDDDQSILDLISAALVTDFEMRTLSICPDVFEALENIKPDLLILDLKLPGSDGYAICQKLRLHHAFSSLPVILLTGVDLNAVKHNYKKVAADDFLLKPFDPATLVQKVENLFSASAG